MLLTTDKEKAIEYWLITHGYKGSSTSGFRKRSANGHWYRYIIRNRVLRFEKQYRQPSGQLRWKLVRDAQLVTTHLSPCNKLEANWRFHSK